MDKLTSMTLFSVFCFIKPALFLHLSYCKESFSFFNRVKLFYSCTTLPPCHDTSTALHTWKGCSEVTLIRSNLFHSKINYWFTKYRLIYAERILYQLTVNKVIVKFTICDDLEWLSICINSLLRSVCPLPLFYSSNC